MKNSIFFSGAKYVLAASIFSLIVGCNDPINQFDPEKYYGRVKIKIGVEIDIMDQGARTSAVPTEDFMVEVLDVSGNPVKSYDRFADIDGDILLEPGSYLIRVKSSAAPVTGFDQPFYMGSSDIFSIDYEEIIEVNVQASLANCMVSVDYSSIIKDTFVDYYTHITNASGELTFVMNEIRPGYFIPESLTISSYLTFNNPDGTTGTKTISGTIDNPLARHHYLVLINGELTSGAVPFQITVDETTVTENISIGQTGDQGNDPVIGYGNLLITEIMYNPEALSDTEGEWFEIYNASASTIDLNQLTIRKGADVQFTLSESYLLNAGDFFVFSKSASATSNAGFVYGASLTLTNAGDHLVLANYGTNGADGSVIAEVDYGLPGFPTATGISLNLDPDAFSANLAKDGANWCLATSPYETGDLGTPGLQNTVCQ